MGYKAYKAHTPPQNEGKIGKWVEVGGKRKETGRLRNEGRERCGKMKGINKKDGSLLKSKWYHFYENEPTFGEKAFPF